VLTFPNLKNSPIELYSVFPEIPKPCVSFKRHLVVCIGIHGCEICHPGVEENVWDSFRESDNSCPDPSIMLGEVILVALVSANTVLRSCEPT
jgi:hypothetical protein